MLAVIKGAAVALEWMNSTFCGLEKTVTVAPDLFVRVRLLKERVNSESLSLAVVETTTGTEAAAEGGGGMGGLMEPHPVTKTAAVVAKRNGSEAEEVRLRTRTVDLSRESLGFRMNPGPPGEKILRYLERFEPIAWVQPARWISVS